MSLHRSSAFSSKSCCIELQCKDLLPCPGRKTTGLSSWKQPVFVLLAAASLKLSIFVSKTCFCTYDADVAPSETLDLPPAHDSCLFLWREGAVPPASLSERGFFALWMLDEPVEFHGHRVSFIGCRGPRRKKPFILAYICQDRFVMNSMHCCHSRAKSARRKMMEFLVNGCMPQERGSNLLASAADSGHHGQRTSAQQEGGKSQF